MAVSAAQLNGHNGYRLVKSGTAVTVAGDINGDGLADLIVGAGSGDPADRTNAGETYVVFGRREAGAAMIQAADVNGTVGFVINGAAAEDTSGMAVAYAGDLNHDGISDLAIGAPLADPNGNSDAGTVYVVFGKAGATRSSIELSELTPTTGFKMTGLGRHNHAGASIAGIGDYNQDGVDDLLIGAPYSPQFYGEDSVYGLENSRSYTYILYGSATLGADIALTTLSGSAGVKLVGGYQDELGNDVAAAGDINHDGRADIIITRYYGASQNISGSPAYGRLMFGPPGATVDPQVDWRITKGDFDSDWPSDVSGIGDFNNDGIDDFVLTLSSSASSSNGASIGGTNLGATAAIIYGRTGGWEQLNNNLSAAKGMFLLGGDGRLASVSGAGDVNGDGIDDVVVGLGSTAYVIFGGVHPFKLDFRNMPVDQGFAITSVGTDPKVAGGGDLNGDGLDDIAVTSSTGTYVVYGFGMTKTGTAGADTLVGGHGADTLVGLGGDDILIGWEGADTMDGGAGSDTYYVDNAGDVIIEEPVDGIDRVASSVSYVMGADADIEILEAVTLSGTDPLNFTGNRYGNTLVGNNGTNRLDGGAGGDVLYGLGGDDILIGGTGVDVMDGGAGSDTYYVDNADDVVFEYTTPGVDRVAATVSWVMTADSDIETLEAITSIDTTAMDLSGNDYGNTIVGNAGINLLKGGGGSDLLIAYAGNDILDGGTGADTMIGGTGFDTYYVDNIGDVVDETGSVEPSRIITSISYTMGASLRYASLEAVSGTAPLNLTGNAYSNTLIGNDGANIMNGGGSALGNFPGDSLYGMGGDDIFIGSYSAANYFGGTGNDTYYVFDRADQIREASGAGTDRIAALTSFTLERNVSVEIIEAITSTATDAFDFTGNNFSNTLVGNAGANILNGGGGADVLIGYGGSDTFQFSFGAVDVNDGMGANNVDQIIDFASGTDRIALNGGSFSLATGALSSDAFVVGAEAQDSNDRIVYDQQTGALFYDNDGSGSIAAVQFASLLPNTALVSGDFLVY